MPQNQKTTEYRVNFPPHAEARIRPLLDRVGNVFDIEWEFTDEELKLTVNSEAISFSHPRSATAFLDALMIGYDAGFADGRSDGDFSH